MNIDKLIFKNEQWSKLEKEECSSLSVNIVFVFGHCSILKQYNHSSLLKQIYPNAYIVGCSTAGNILDTSIDEYSAVASAISFDSAYVRVHHKMINTNTLLEDAHFLVNKLDKKNLKHIFFLTPGMINGSEIVKGLKLSENITVTGGLAGDSNIFENTYQFFDENQGKDIAVIIGFYGQSIHVGIGCETGWKEFGANRIVTKATKNVVYEIDHKPAIELYEKYLGETVYDFPSSTLRFPLGLKDSLEDKNRLTRTIMHINQDKSLVFAGDIKEGSIVRLMKTNVSNVLDGAFLSAKKIRPYNNKRSLALIVSCISRRNVLKQFCEEEIEIVQDILTPSAQIIGFYSYGEIAPFSNNLLKPLLHNQTMTITTIYED